MKNKYKLIITCSGFGTEEEVKKQLAVLSTADLARESWENYGEWHIDHIIPLCNYNKETCTTVINALSNLQPLWATENLKKHKYIKN